MKRVILSLALVGGFALFSESMLNAQETTQKKATTEQVAGSGFVDSNGDGICDNYDGKQAGKGLGSANGEGVGKSEGKRRGTAKGVRDGSGSGERLKDGTGSRKGNRKGKRDGTGVNCNVVTE